MTDNTDSFDVGEELTSESDLDRLKKLADEALSIELNIEAIESMLATEKAKLQHIKAKQMPDIMMEKGVPEIIIGDKKFKLSKYVSGSFPKEGAEREMAVATLEEYGGEGLMTSDVTVSFGKGSHNEYIDLREKLIEQGYAAVGKEAVNTASFHAFIRNRLEEGLPVDADALGIMVGNVVKITEVKAKASKKVK